MIDKNTKIKDFISLINSKNACKEGVDWCEKLCVNKSETMDKLVLELKDQCWITWVIENFYDQLEIELRKKFFDIITDAMLAFHLYITMDCLNNEEDNILISKFKNKLPTAEKELEDKIVLRIKK